MRVHRNCCGLDVHKKMIAACLLRERLEGFSREAITPESHDPVASKGILVVEIFQHLSRRTVTNPQRALLKERVHFVKPHAAC